MAPAKIFIINLFNALNNLNAPALNDFKQLMRAKADQAINSPYYVISTAQDISPIEGFAPINYVRPYEPQPTTISQPYDVKPTTEIKSSITPQYLAQPTTGPQIQPTPEPISGGGTMGSSRLASKVQPSKIKVKITKAQSIKIIETIINNSTNTSGLISGVEEVKTLFDQLTGQINIERAIEIGSIVVGGVSILLALKRFYSSRKGTREERQRLIGEKELMEDPELGRDAPVVVNMGTAFGFSAISMGRFLEIVKDANPMTLAQHMINLARNMYRSMTESDLADAVQRGAQDLRNDLTDALAPRIDEVVVDPSVRASEIEARRRVKQALERHKELKQNIDLAKKKKKFLSSKEMASSSKEMASNSKELDFIEREVSGFLDDLITQLKKDLELVQSSTSDQVLKEADKINLDIQKLQDIIDENDKLLDETKYDQILDKVNELGDKLQDEIEKEYPAQKTTTEKRYATLISYDNIKASLFLDYYSFKSFLENELISSNKEEIIKQLTNYYKMYYTTYNLIKSLYKDLQGKYSMPSVAFQNIETANESNIGLIRANYLSNNFIGLLGNLKLYISYIKNAISTQTDQSSIDLLKYLNDLNQFIGRLSNIFGDIPAEYIKTKVLTKKK